MSNEPTRQHHRLATGENLSGQAQGDKTHDRYAGGGKVKGSFKHMHEHADHHGHEDMNAHHPKDQRGGHVHDDLHGHYKEPPGRSGGSEAHSTGGSCGTPGAKTSKY